MENEDNGRNAKWHFHNAIRCAKAAMLISSLTTRIHLQEKEAMKQTIDEQKMEVVQERLKRRKMKVSNLIEFAIQIVLLFTILTYLLLLAFGSC